MANACAETAATIASRATPCHRLMQAPSTRPLCFNALPRANLLPKRKYTIKASPTPLVTFGPLGNMSRSTARTRHASGVRASDDRKPAGDKSASSLTDDLTSLASRAFREFTGGQNASGGQSQQGQDLFNLGSKVFSEASKLSQNQARKAETFADETVPQAAQTQETAGQAGHLSTQQKLSKLVLSLIIDAIGVLAGLHILVFDFGWAPISALIVQRLYRTPLLTSVAFGEQVLPGVNFLPTATIGWALENVPALSFVSRLPFMGGLAKRDKAWWQFW